MSEKFSETARTADVTPAPVVPVPPIGTGEVSVGTEEAPVIPEGRRVVLVTPTEDAPDETVLEAAVVPNNENVPVDDNAEPANAEVTHSATEAEVNGTK